MKQSCRNQATCTGIHASRCWRIHFKDTLASQPGGKKGKKGKAGHFRFREGSKMMNNNPRLSMTKSAGTPKFPTAHRCKFSRKKEKTLDPRWPKFRYVPNQGAVLCFMFHWGWSLDVRPRSPCKCSITNKQWYGYELDERAVSNSKKVEK